MNFAVGRCPLRRVKDSNLRAISDSRVSSAVLSASQPTLLFVAWVLPSGRATTS